MAVTSSQDETQPLLAEERQALRTPTPVPQDIDTDKNHALYPRVMLTLGLVAVAAEIAYVMTMASSARVYEIIYCKQYFEHTAPSLIQPDGSIPEEYCKIDAVQSQVSTLRGGQVLWSNLPTILVALFVGLLADRWSRKWLVFINLICFTLRSAWVLLVCAHADSVDLRLVWLESILVVFGGGVLSMSSLFYTIISDVTANSQKATVFFQLNAFVQVGTLLGPLIAGALISWDPWKSLGLSVACWVVPTIISLTLPETLNARTSPSDPGLPVAAAPIDGSDAADPPRTRIERCLNSVQSALGFLFDDWRILVMSSLYPVRIVFNPLDQQLIQYIPQRFHLHMSDATFIMALYNTLSGLVLLLLLPYTAWYLTKRALKRFTPAAKDLLFIRTGFLATSVGWLLVGLAPNIYTLIVSLGVLSLGYGTGPALRALVTTWVEPEQVGRLYSTMVILECGGFTGGGPAVAALYNAGLRANSDALLGLPWLVFGLVGLLVTFFVFLARWTRPEDVTTTGVSNHADALQNR